MKKYRKKNTEMKEEIEERLKILRMGGRKKGGKDNRKKKRHKKIIIK